MNIQMQCCGLVLLLVLLYFYLRQKKLQLVTEKAFFIVFIAMLSSIILDIVSVVVIMQMEHLPQFLVGFVSKSYLVSLVSVAASCLGYVCVDVYIDSPRYKKYLHFISGTVLVAYAVIYVLPIEYYYNAESKSVYTHGHGVMATYGLSVLILLSVMVIMQTQRSRINPKRREAVQIWMLLWISAATIQAFWQEMLMVSFAGCVGVMVLYVKLENPEANLERKTGLFNQNALMLYANQMYNRKEEFSAIFMLFEGEAGKEANADLLAENDLQLVNYLMGIPKTKVFKKSREELVLIVRNKQLGEEWTYRIRDYLKRIGLNPFIFLIPEANTLEGQDELFYLIRYARENNHEMAEKRLNILSEEIISAMYHERTITRQIINAMNSGLVEVFYQPIYSTKERRFTSAEALVRIRDEEGKIVPPGLFIEVAEKNGMIIRLGEMVFEKVCRFIKEHRIEQYGMEYIEVNLSVVQCADENLADNFIEIMERYNINPRMINLEITESASLNAKKILLDNMMCLINYGVKFSLDDFGTGQSNLNYIVDMPVDIVKFDRYMTNAYFENKKAKYVMNAAMHMIHGMELEIVSEGIETEKQYEAMLNLGIAYIQGYYFSKPLPEPEFLQFITANM